MAGGTKLHTWISYPQTAGRRPSSSCSSRALAWTWASRSLAGGGANWLRAIADQLASEGFIAVLPDLTSGLGPNGGNYDSFQLPDESGAALNRIPHCGGPRPHPGRARLRAQAADGERPAGRHRLLHGRRPCVGGGGRDRGVNASVVFYGTPPAGTGDVADQGARSSHSSAPTTSASRRGSRRPPRT